MYPNGAPWLDVLSKDIIGIGIALLILMAGVILRGQISAILNVIVARPVYLLHLRMRGVEEWRYRHHSPEYVEAQYA